MAKKKIILASFNWYGAWWRSQAGAAWDKIWYTSLPVSLPLLQHTQVQRAVCVLTALGKQWCCWSALQESHWELLAPVTLNLPCKAVLWQWPAALQRNQWAPALYGLQKAAHVRWDVDACVGSLVSSNSFGDSTSSSSLRPINIILLLKKDYIISDFLKNSGISLQKALPGVIRYEF